MTPNAQRPTPIIELIKARKEYPSRRGPVTAVDDVDLSIAAGEFVAVTGPSGSGKSTLLSLVAGLSTATQGEVRVVGKSLTHMNAKDRASMRSNSIGFVFQLFHLVPYLNVRDNVRLGGNGQSSAASLDQRTNELLEQFRLSDRAEHIPGRLSVGERQRTAMARALINRPQILLADEPTGNLDRERATEVLNELSELAERGTAVLMVTHDREASDRAQRVVRLRNGRIDESSG